MRTGFKMLAPDGGSRPLSPGGRRPLVPRDLEGRRAETLVEKLAHSLAEERALPVKELFESLEFFARVRGYVRSPVVADLCCGHGLTGILFAVFERSVESVLLVDRVQPPSHARVLAAALRVAPWIGPKVEFRRVALRTVAHELEPGTGVVAVHACGLKTDRALDAAVAVGGPVAVMPCCHPEAHCTAPPTLVQHLGLEAAFDVDRTYRLERAGYRVRWDEVPEAITPMARILVGVPRRAGPP